MINLIVKKTVEVTLVARVKNIEEEDGRFKINLLYSTRELYLDKNKIEILRYLERSRDEEKPITVAFDGNTGFILRAEIKTDLSP